ncbi:hypothetical protein [uncultured Serinicoccus sp.]|uniref:hypothetical protein n=1 Tax=uncultured Serinicoccus sp. TaxID=735514 RepID=UPI002638D894|nr:hypothetical protein [uncultured Serinicoccus sp.]
MEVTNQTAVDMTDVSFVLDDAILHQRKVLGSADQVHSGRIFGVSATADELGLPPLPLEQETKARGIINSDLVPRVSLHFSIRGERFVRTGADVRRA